jgi:hypothetical protein
MLTTHTLGASGTLLLSILVAACGESKATGSGGTGAGSTTDSTSTGTGATTGSTSTGAGAGGGSTTTGSSSSSSGSTTGLFLAPEPWNTPIDQDPTDPSSDTIIQWLASNGGWGNGNVLQIDLSFNIQYANADTPMVPFHQPGGPCTPDCDDVTTFPVPVGGAVEGNMGYACVGGGDCHLLVVDQPNNKLYEMFEAFSPPDPNVFNTGSGAFIWDLTKAYPSSLRGDGCTSADAAGYPIAAMLFTPDEIAAGHIDHAIRFALPPGRIRDGDVFFNPATHTGVTMKPQTTPDAPPYGVRFRLKSGFDLTKLPNAGARTVAIALQKYGMMLADGGNIALMATEDTYTTAKWSDPDVNMDTHAMYAIQVTDFEVVPLGTLVTTGDTCVRNP